MVINGYTDVLTLATFIGVDDADLDTELTAAINAASRQIDAHCGRRFWQDSEVKTRQFYADDYYCVDVDDISTTTGLVVKIDTGDDGTFSTTLTETTDFILHPLNAADETPVWPYDSIVMTDTYTFPMNSRRPGVQVTAQFGWPAIPDDVTQACLIQSKNLYKAASGTFSGFQLSSEAGIVMRTPGLDGVAAALLERYRKGLVG